MVKIDLITGFLGSGKTTFIKKYARYLMDCGNNIGILENDFGAVNVDMMLLQDLQGDNCELEMIAGGCDYECHKRRFKTKLISMGMCGYDRVIVEPSGIYDVDEFFDVLNEEPLDRWYESGNVITIVDAGLDKELSEQSEYLLASQVAQAGQIILSKTQTISKEQMEETMEHLNCVLEKFQCKRRFAGVQDTKRLEDLTKEDFNQIVQAGYTHDTHTKLWFDQAEAFQSVYFMNLQMSEDKLKSAVRAILQDEACGKVFRIKGFMQTEEGKWMELNATKEKLTVNPINNGQEILILIGEALVEEAIKKHFE